ncbi:hypothetical protein [Hydrogenophaga sp. 2FB]|uniref:hypothetical protein n=1 Tax=Hydrogenophaga sp. 2FB TaxID=2502187 RepID=UPI0010F559EC|nr:hypothetical protein [Hydrogenophaga sp. 2FB]
MIAWKGVPFLQRLCLRLCQFGGYTAELARAAARAGFLRPQGTPQPNGHSLKTNKSEGGWTRGITGGYAIPFWLAAASAVAGTAILLGWRRRLQESPR